MFSTAIVRLNNIVFNYGNQSLFSGLSLELRQGIVTALLGTSGCGKTTVLRLVSGLEVPAKGEVWVNGQLASKDGKIIIPAHKRKVSFIFQDLALWPHMTVEKNIFFAVGDRPGQETLARVKGIISYLGLDGLMGKYPHQLSGGQKQLVAIARALASDPGILLMDEPLANLDVKLKRKILELIRQLVEDFEITVVYVTHDHREAFSIADDVVVMSRGKIEDNGSVEEIKGSDNEYVRYFLEF